MVLTGLTVWVAYYDLGRWNAIVALSIAVLKATLVVLYFMHVRYSSKLTWVFVCSGFLWLLILFAFTLSDYFTRHWVPIAVE
jgi:cytochrome c oxidase subunit 4